MTAPPLADPAQLGDETWDVVVVGAGPAGSVAARRLALAGARVLLLEKRRLPREKACGDALIPDAITCLRRNGLLSRVRARAAAWTSGRVYSPFGHALEVSAEVLTIRRAELDAELACGAAESGAVLAIGTAERVIEESPAGVRFRDHVAVYLSGEARAIRARYVLIATGATAALADGCRMLVRQTPSAVALRTYIHAGLELSSLVVSFDRRVLPGYGWIFPMGHGVFNVGCGVVLDAGRVEPVDLRRRLDDFLGRLPVGRELLAAARGRERPRGAYIRYGLTGTRPYSGHRVLAAGEAIGSTYPLTGEGIGKAMETAELAADALTEALRGGGGAALLGYEAQLERRLRPWYRGYEFAARCARRPWMAETILRQISSRPRLRAAVEGILAERVHVERVFSRRGLVRAFLS